MCRHRSLSVETLLPAQRQYTVYQVVGSMWYISAIKWVNFLLIFLVLIACVVEAPCPISVGGLGYFLHQDLDLEKIL